MVNKFLLFVSGLGIRGLAWFVFFVNEIEEMSRRAARRLAAVYRNRLPKEIELHPKASTACKNGVMGPKSSKEGPWDANLRFRNIQGGVRPLPTVAANPWGLGRKGCEHWIGE